MKVHALSLCVRFAIHRPWLNMRRSCRQLAVQRSAFSLVELLVVIAVIMILMSILIVVIRKLWLVVESFRH